MTRGLRHQGTGYCTFIGNDLFSFFKSTGSKSRINFLEILSEEPGYCFNDFSFDYMVKRGLSPKYITAISKIKGECFRDTEKFLAALKSLSVSQKYAVKTITEAGLLGHLIDQGMPESMVILSDDAGQFDVMTHALCWTCRKKPAKNTHLYSSTTSRT